MSNQSIKPNATHQAAISGVLNIHKPLGLTSHDVVYRIRKMARQRKVGHAGTLDPLATGVLLVCLGQGTRVSQYLMNSTKTYLATIRLGITTTTHDAEGEIVKEKPVSASRADFEAVLPPFIGSITQIPPMYSAIKYHGTKLYKLARRGITIERAPREIVIHTIEIVAWEPQRVQIKVICGSGTYIRALARDIGEQLGCGAYLENLCRTSSGQFTLETAATLETLNTAFDDHTIHAWLHPLDVAFQDWATVDLDIQQARQITSGQTIHVPALVDTGNKVCAYGPDKQFLGLIQPNPDIPEIWMPHKIFVRAESLGQCTS